MTHVADAVGVDASATDAAVEPLPSIGGTHGLGGRCVGAGAQQLVRDVLALTSDRWSMPVIRALENGPVRFTRLMKAVPGISHRMLTRTLRGLQRDGLVGRTSYPESPPRVEYELTILGRSFGVPFTAFVEWTIQHRSEIERSRARFDE